MAGVAEISPAIFSHRHARFRHLQARPSLTPRALSLHVRRVAPRKRPIRPFSHNLAVRCFWFRAVPGQTSKPAKLTTAGAVGRHRDQLTKRASPQVSICPPVNIVLYTE